MPKRDKLISVRVNENLLNRVKDIIDKEFIKYEYVENRFYRLFEINSFYYYRSNANVADILEAALIQFISKFEAR